MKVNVRQLLASGLVLLSASTMASSVFGTAMDAAVKAFVEETINAIEQIPSQCEAPGTLLGEAKIRAWERLNPDEKLSKKQRNDIVRLMKLQCTSVKNILVLQELRDIAGPEVWEMHDGEKQLQAHMTMLEITLSLY